MYIAISKVQKAVVYRCEKVETVRALVNIELAHTNVAIFEETHFRAWSAFEISYLQELHENLTNGANPHSRDEEYLIGQLVRLCQTVTPSKVDAFEASVQAMQLKFHDKGNYRYAAGASYAKPVEEPYWPVPLVGNWQAAQALPLTRATTQAPAPAQPQAIAQPWANVQTAPPKYAPPWAK
jgi:hypothetical protein